MKLYRLNDQSLYESRQFVIGDQVYPAGWLATATEDELAALGITVEIVEDPPPPPQEPRLVRKSVIIDRLHAAGQLDAAYAVLQSASLYDRQRWESRDAIYFNDPTLLAALTAVGADPEAILAPE